MAHPQVADEGDSLKFWRVAANILNKQSRTADEGWSSSFGVWRGANNSSPYKISLLRKTTRSLGRGRITWINDLSERKWMRFGTWNVRSMYRACSLRAVVKEISKYKLDLVGVWEIRWDGGGREPAGKYTFVYAKGNENHELGTGFFIHKRIMSVVKRVEFIHNTKRSLV
jgi:hypothetical protein